MEQYLRVGVITRSHGIHGEVKVFPTTDSVNRFSELKDVIIKGKRGDIKATVESAKSFNNIAIVKFSCFNTPEETVGFSGCDVMISRDQAQPLEEGEYYIADLIGCRIYAAEGSDGFETGTELGVLKDVLQTGANDVYVINGKDGEILLPVIPQCIKNVDIEKGEITAFIMKGLL